MIAALFLKPETITPHLLRVFIKYFLHRQHNQYIGVAINTNLLILI